MQRFRAASGQAAAPGRIAGSTPGPARGGGRVQRRCRPAADQRRVPFGQGPALPSGRHARAGRPAVRPGMPGAAAKGRAPVGREEWTGGHDQVWQQQLPVALGWLLRPNLRRSVESARPAAGTAAWPREATLLLDGAREVRFPARGDCCSIIGFSSLLRGTRPLLPARSSCQRRRGQSAPFRQLDRPWRGARDRPTSA
jgi:hypothetical protein